MRPCLSRILVVAATVTAVAGCGSLKSTQSTQSSSPKTVPAPQVRQAHPQVVEPSAGQQAVIPSDSGSVALGGSSAHAPSLSVVKQELKQLNLCGGTTNSADATPFAKGGPGFVPDPGTQQTEGVLPELTARLNALGKALGVTIYGISGYRTPAQSVAVGGYADDPHTKGEAEDIGVNSLLRSSAGQISEAQLAQYGLYRPFDPSDNPDNTEVNHLQMIPAGGPVPLAVVDATFDPDPHC
jgi:hypothetical protein